MQKESGIAVEETKEIKETQDEKNSSQPKVIPQNEQLNEFMRKKFLESSEVLMSLDASYIKHLDKHQEGMEKRLEKVFKKNKEPEFVMIPTQKQTYVVDNDTLQSVEYDHLMEMRALIRKEYEDLAKTTCPHCYGSAVQSFAKDKPGDMLLPIICNCVVKNYNKNVATSPAEYKDQLSLLHSILYIPEQKIPNPEKSNVEDIVAVIDKEQEKQSLIESSGL